ncbi:efflux RND transporter periplasmic adaptor subunit [Gayadomonas joobiniege]|uniref:efflux RND transporter periplasmic adaptor subunit n=1 Tax=Gayadomonas joobiniege TaxID=1234606 RepID=UPI00037553BA|nr:efflux RND transporter periplasmic adaptor subunit [Gayadomonas joobiniege]
MNVNKKHIVSILLIAIVCFIIWFMFFNKPQAFRGKPPQVARISVEVETIKPADYVVKIASYGRINALRQSELSAQVSGRVVYVAESMRSGGFFAANEVLVKLEDTDYKAQLQVAYAQMIEAEQGLIEEKALAEQAKGDWQRLGNKDKPNALVLREPQLAAAKAQYESAKASYELAKVNLQRTEIKAPYQGRVLSKNVDIGQLVSSNTIVGEVYATDALEIELPVKNSEIPLLDLPESYMQTQQQNKLTATIISSLSGRAERWQGHIVRTASAIDEQTRQLHLIARINDPFGEKAHGRLPLKIGQYVTAEINGKTIKDAITISNKTIYQGKYVYLYKDGVLQRQNISILWQNQDTTIVAEGLKAGDQIVTTPLGQVISGTPVKIKGESAEEKHPRGQKKPLANADKQGGAA